MRELKLAANGLNSRRLAAGPDSGRSVLMLHGFPEGAESRERPARRTATGHEQGAGTRPGLVVSTDDFNNSGAGLVIVAPLTTSQRGYPSRIQVGSGESGLRETSWAAVEHFQSLSVIRLREYRGSVDRTVLTEVERVLDLLLFDRSDSSSSG